MPVLDPEQFAWMREDGVSAIFSALPEGSVRFVGGCIRNALMGQVVSDIDLATQLPPEKVAAALEAASIRFVPTGIDADFDGQIYDPTGQGLTDLEAQRFRFVGDADARIKEDYLRILRFFRFLAWYGRTANGALSKPDAAALKACRDNAKGLKKLSAERVWMEVKKLLLAPDPCRALRIMLTHDILETILPEASNVEGLELLVALERREAINPDPLLRLMALSTREPLPMALLTKRFKMSNAEKTRLVKWAADSTSLDPNADDRAKRIAIYSVVGTYLEAQ